METKLKQRVIGAVLLTTLAVIVLPMLLDGSAEDRARVNSAIPEPPKIAVKSLSVSQVKQAMTDMENASAAKLPLESSKVKSQVKRPQSNSKVDVATLANGKTAEDYLLDKNDLPISWSLQMGSFRNKDNAINLRKSLRESEYRSYILSADTANGQVFRVFVGPILNKKTLQAYSKEIESTFKMKGQVVRYKIEDDANQLGG